MNIFINLSKNLFLGLFTIKNYKNRKIFANNCLRNIDKKTSSNSNVVCHPLISVLRDIQRCSNAVYMIIGFYLFVKPTCGSTARNIACIIFMKYTCLNIILNVIYQKYLFIIN